MTIWIRKSRWKFGLALMGVFLFSIGIWKVPGIVDPAASLILILLSLLTAVFGFRIAGKKSFPASLRWSWGLIGLGNITSIAGEGIWAYLSSVQGADPFPSIADAFYLLTYPLILAGVLSLPYAPRKVGQKFQQYVDMGIVMLVAGVFLWYWVVSGILAKGGTGWEHLVSSAYPTGDLLILMGLVSLIQQEVRGLERRVVYLLVASITLSIFADIAFALWQANSAISNASVMGILWILGRWAVLEAVMHQSRQQEFRVDVVQRFSPLLRTGLLYGAVFAGLGLTMFALAQSFRANWRTDGTLLGALGITALVLIRQYFVLRENRRLYREVEKLALTDSLTTLPNRRLFDEVLGHEIDRAQRYGRQLSLLVIDLDHFKSYNDRFGHLHGDALLRDFAAMLKFQLRSGDLPARYGGDEFVVILPETDVETSTAVVEKLYRSVKRISVMNEGVDISIGCAALRPGMTPADLIAQADEAMYRDKPHARRVAA